MQMSSAMPPMCGKKLLIDCCDWPNLLNLACGPKHKQLLALQLRDRLALGERLGHRLAVHRGELRLFVEQFQVRRPARHAQEDHALGLLHEVQRIHDAAVWLLAALV